MGNISKYLKMNFEELEAEINKQNKKIASAKETISLLKKLQIATNANVKKERMPVPQFNENS